MPSASCYINRFFNRVIRQTLFGSFATVFEDQFNCLTKAITALLKRLTLAVRAGNFQAIADVPIAILFINGVEFVLHSSSPAKLRE